MKKVISYFKGDQFKDDLVTIIFGIWILAFAIYFVYWLGEKLIRIFS